MESSKFLDKPTYNIGSTNPPPQLIPDDDDSLTDSSVSVSGGDILLNNELESVQPPEPLSP